MARFIHASDLHLAKPFGRFDEDVRVRLRIERMNSIARLAAAARGEDAPIVLLAGDTFDAETPPPKTTRQALKAMGREPGVTWILMPGNHDSLAASELWSRVAEECPPNVVLGLNPEPIVVGDLEILPAPPTTREPGRDLTAWFDDAGATDRIRVGIAHGGVQNFGADDERLSIIPPDRAERAGLDYLALGDWHGQMRIGSRTWYSGTVEADSFKPHAAAGCLLVDIPSRGAVPEVTPMPLGQIVWRALSPDLRPGDDALAVLDAAIPEGDRSSMMISVRAAGRLPLSERSRLSRHLAAIQHDFLHFEADLDELRIEEEVGDLDLIDGAGALRQAAEALLEASRDPAHGQEDRRIAGMALTRLFEFAQEDAR